MDFNNFRGGLNTLASPYQLEGNQLSDMQNLDIEYGGLKLRCGTKAKYGPFLGNITNIQKAIDANDNKLIFVDSGNKLEFLINGHLAVDKFDINYPTKIIHKKNGFYIRKDNLLLTLKSFVCRVNANYVVPPYNFLYVFLNKTEFDFMSDGVFPTNLNGYTIIDSRNNKLYYCQDNVNCDNTNIYTELLTSKFKYLGVINNFVRIYSNLDNSPSISGITLKPSIGSITIDPYSIASLLVWQSLVENSTNKPNKAIQSENIIWHPASMRYFAAGNKTNPQALYISDPDDITKFQSVNILYPHLNLGKITSLSIVEKSALVGYEYGWSHYVGLDPTTDAQWSLLSIPDGCKYGQTVMPTPSAISFFTNNGIVGFSTSLLMLQTMFTPSANQYKFFSKGKLIMKMPTQKCTSFYKDGKYYLVLDGNIYIYNYQTDAFILYKGLDIKVITDDFDGNLILAHKNYIVTFDEAIYTDFDPLTGSKKPIEFSASFPIVGITKDNEVARITNMDVKSLSEENSIQATLSIESELYKNEYPLDNTNNLIYQNGNWVKNYFNSRLCENLFNVDISGNIFFISISGQTNITTPQDFNVLNIFVNAKKERNKIC
jgi:hypothetical protein